MLDGIYGCLTRIENKINELPSGTDGGTTVVTNPMDETLVKELRQEFSLIKTTIGRTASGIASIQSNTISLNDKMMSLDRLLPTMDKIAKSQESFQNEVKNKFEKTYTCIEEGANTPKVKNHHHRITFDNKYVLLSFIALVVIVLNLSLYMVSQPNYDHIDNDLKYRYIKMKGEASPKMISELENIFELNRDNTRIRQMLKDVKTYEEAVLKQATLNEQARLKAIEAKEQEQKAKSIKEKQNDKSPQSNKSKP